jgi:hypothetical protein
MRSWSATFDEGAHLPAGYTYLALGDHRLNPEQPPLVKLLAAAPLLALRPMMKADDEAWTTARQWEFGRRFLYRWNDGDRLLFWGRLPVVALACALAAAVFFWARRLFGPSAAAIALLLCVLSPDVLAHGHLVTTDLGLSLFFFLSVVAFERLSERATRGGLLLAGLALGAAFATKFSAPILVPVLAVLAVVAAIAPEPMVSVLSGRERVMESRAGRVTHGAVMLAGMGLIAFVVLWASYGFRGPVSHGLLPDDYVRGLLFVLEHSEARPTFLLGQLSDHASPYFFPVTFALKTPLPLVVLLVLAAFATPRLSWRTAAFLWVPVVVYLAFTFTRGLQIGHRHLLPIYPFLFVAAGRSFIDPPPYPSPRRGRGTLLRGMRRVAVVALGTWYAVGTLRVHPHYLAYFNELAGGPRNGYKRLVDSSLDWGQDLKGLRAWMDARGVARIKLSYFGSADPSYYGIDAEALPGYSAPHPVRITREVRPGDLVAVSATNLQGVYLDPEDRPLMERFRRSTPIDQVGYSILIYRADFAWPAP